MVRLLTGDETGLKKQVSIEKEQALKWGTQSRRHGLTHMRWSGQVSDADISAAQHDEDTDGKLYKRLCKEAESYVTTINRSGIVQTWETSTQNLAHQFQAFENPFHKTEMEQQNGEDGKRESADLTQYTPAAVQPEDSETCAGLDVLPTQGENQFPRGHPTRFVVATKDGKIRLFDINGEDGVSSFHSSENLEVMRYNHAANIIATAGKESFLRLWDPETHKEKFCAKNVPHNFLDMRVPYWESDAQFWVPRNDGSRRIVDATENNGNMVVTCSRYRYIRLYDARAQKRPVISFEYGQWPLKRIAVGHDKNYVYTGDTTGDLHRFDLRTQRLVCSYQGHSGAIKDISVHPTQQLVASVGYGRCLYLHEVESHQIVKRVYLKQRLNCVLFTAEGRKKPSSVGISVSSNSVAVSLAKRKQAEDRENSRQAAVKSQRKDNGSWATGSNPAAFSTSNFPGRDKDIPKAKCWEENGSDSDSEKGDDIWSTLEQNAAYNARVDAEKSNGNSSESTPEDANSLLSDEASAADESDDGSSDSQADDHDNEKRWIEEWANASEGESISSEDDQAAALVDSKKAQHRMKKETTEARRSHAKAKKSVGGNHKTSPSKKRRKR